MGSVLQAMNEMQVMNQKAGHVLSASVAHETARRELVTKLDVVGLPDLERFGDPDWPPGPFLWGQGGWNQK